MMAHLRKAEPGRGGKPRGRRDVVRPFVVCVLAWAVLCVGEMGKGIQDSQAPQLQQQTASTIEIPQPKSCSMMLVQKGNKWGWMVWLKAPPEKPKLAPLPWPASRKEAFKACERFLDEGGKK